MRHEAADDVHVSQIDSLAIESLHKLPASLRQTLAFRRIAAELPEDFGIPGKIIAKDTVLAGNNSVATDADDGRNKNRFPCEGFQHLEG